MSDNNIHNRDVFGRLPGVPRPDPNRVTPSRLQNNPDDYMPENYSGLYEVDPSTGNVYRTASPNFRFGGGGGAITAAGADLGKGELIRAARGDFGIFSFVSSGGRQRAVSQDMRRCYLEVQNNSDDNIELFFGSSSGSIIIPPQSTWWAPVAPVSEVYFDAPVGAKCSVVTASD